MANYAILRIEKLKDPAAIRRSLEHCFRARETPNADPARLSENVHFGATTVQEAMAALEERLPAKIRTNGVRVVEYLMTASPEVMNEKSPAARTAYLADALEWLRKRHGAENVFVATIHDDETTAHLSAFVVPFDARGRLNARSFFGGAKALSDMQTDYADKVGTRHGLVRGEEKSGANHVSIREYYRTIKRAQEALPAAEEILATQKDVGFFDGSRGVIAPAIVDAVKSQPALLAENRRLQGDNERLQRQVAAQVKVIAKMRAAEVREIPLDIVLKALGAQHGGIGSRIWKSIQGPIVLDAKDSQTFVFDGRRGRGAIDLVRALDGKNFEPAVGWLLALKTAEITPLSIATAAALSAAGNARTRVAEACEIARNSPAIPITEVETSGEGVDRVREFLKSDLQIAPILIESRQGKSRIAAARVNGEACPAFALDPDPKDGRAAWCIVRPVQKDERTRGEAQSFTLAVRKPRSTAARSICVYTERVLDALAIATAFLRRAIYQSFDIMVVVATNGISFESLRGTVRQHSKECVALVGEYARDDRGKTLLGHLTRALREEKVEQQKENVVRPPFPSNCIRWLDVLQQWDEFVRLQEIAETKKEARKLKAAAAGQARSGQCAAGRGLGE